MMTEQMKMAPRFVMIGGFLGAGKTTTISRLARHYQSKGLRVAIVTNDQATDLVDTNLLRSQGFDVGEVAGSCFCCNFNELTRSIERLSAAERPDVVIAEPVGSCTDLVATVIRPLQHIYDEPFEIAPYGVILKPSHGRRILERMPNAGFSPQAEYIFRKQIEEADFVIINRIDELKPAEIERLMTLLQADFPDRPIVQISAKDGQGFPDLVEVLGQQGEFGQRIMEVDYDVYAEGEAELGWLNAQCSLMARLPVALDGFVLSLVRRLQVELKEQQAETAHLKVIGMAEGAYAVANVINNFEEPVLSLASHRELSAFEFVVNARVAIDPDLLEKLVRDAIAEESARAQASSQIRALQCFRPGRPVPTHRLDR